VYHTVTFNVDGDITVVPVEQVRDGLTVSEPADPVQAGYYFYGWYTTDAFTPPRFDFATPVTAPMTLYGRWSAIPPVYHTVTFDVDGDTALVPAAQVRDGDTVTQPADPTRAFTAGAGLWSGAPDALPNAPYTFVEWRHNGAAWDFADDTVTANITLTAYWTAPAAPVPGTENNVIAAVAHVNANPGVFTLLIDENVALGATGVTLTGAGADLTIIGLGGARTITRTGDGPTLTVNGAGRILTIGNNITLQGRFQTLNVVAVQISSEFVMLDGALITGNNTSSFTGAVYLSGVSTFTMRGGRITGNNTRSTISNATGGVGVTGTCTFAMQGGSVSGNTGARGEMLLLAHKPTFYSLAARR